MSYQCAMPGCPATHASKWQMCEAKTSKDESLQMQGRSLLRQAFCPECGRPGYGSDTGSCAWCDQRNAFCQAVLATPSVETTPAASNLLSLVRTLMDECALEWGDNCTCKRCVTIRAIHAELEKPAVETEAPRGRIPLDFVRALKIAEGVFEQYGKDQPKWWRRMDGTPILNDVAVRMAEAFRDEAQSPVKTGAES
jgi:hypothetical protein